MIKTVSVISRARSQIHISTVIAIVNWKAEPGSIPSSFNGNVATLVKLEGNTQATLTTLSTG